jgi:gliding motility-associated-like protein
MQPGIDYFAIYNRYGSLVFKTTGGSTGWDGNYLNIQQPVGTYVWIVKHRDPQTGQSKLKKGSLVLTR